MSKKHSQRIARAGATALMVRRSESNQTPTPSFTAKPYFPPPRPRRYDTDPNSPIARQGGSSITQQLVKNLLLSPERSLRRKLAEAYMSIILETRLSKEKIFELYCNQVYLGQQSGFSINGFGEAADAYFNKDVTTLTLPEAAFLAGLIRSPNRYNPYHDLQTATARRNQVLQSMVDAGAISQLEMAQ